MNHDTVLVLDFGGQYNQLIARRVREANVYCEVLPYNVSVEKILSRNPKGLIFTGGPASVMDQNAPKCDPEIFDLGIPILGICYGMQLMAAVLGGTVDRASAGEYGKVEITLKTDNALFADIEAETSCWMSHTFQVAEMPAGFEVLAKTRNCAVAAMGNAEKKLYGVQFHPEVLHTEKGQEIIKNFLFNICGCQADWKMSSFIEATVERIKETVGSKKVLCALSGGVDSSVAAALVYKAVGKQLTSNLVDHGLLRKNEADQVRCVYTPIRYELYPDQCRAFLETSGRGCRS